MTSKTVPKLTLFERSGVQYFRVVIPKDLHKALGKSKLVESTKTSDKRQAERVAARRHSEILEGFEIARRRLNPQAVAELTPELGQALADHVRHQILSQDDQVRQHPKTLGALYAALAYQANHWDPPSESHPQPLSPPPGLIPGPEHPTFMGATRGQMATTRAFHAQALGLYRDALASGDLRAALPKAEQAAEALGIRVDWHSQALAAQVAACLRKVLEATVQAHEALAARDSGQVVDTPHAPKPQPALKAHKLRDAFDKWKASSTTRADDSVKACERALVLFEGWARNPDLNKISRELGTNFKAHLLTLDSTSKTARDRLNWILSLLKFAAQELEWLPKHPWQGISIEARTTAKRRPWKIEELQRFFSGPLFTAYTLPKDAKAGTEAAYWIPLLGLFTGARISELCQLQVRDVDQDNGLIKIRSEAEGQKLKTESAERDIPIHAELIRLGFLDYVAQLPPQGSLWPTLPLRKGKPGGYFSQWFNETRKAPPISLGDLPDFHCFRHSVRSIMAEQGISEPVQDKITGHAVKGSTGTKVYTHHPLTVLRKAVGVVQYPGLTLPRVYKPKQA
jgi:integrase